LNRSRIDNTNDEEESEKEKSEGASFLENSPGYEDKFPERCRFTFFSHANALQLTPKVIILAKGVKR
jgi:hypothetical protein